MNIVYVLPAKGGGGGAHSVAQEVDELVKMGVNVQIAVNRKNYSSFVTTYSDMPNVCRNVREFTDITSLSKLLIDSDVVVCTIFISVKLVTDALSQLKGKQPKVTYYAQDYEPLFSLPEDPMWQEAYDSYALIPQMTVFAKTDWIRDVIKANHKIEVEKVHPSIDHSVYFPGLEKPSSQLWICAMVRPSTPRRAPIRTLKLLKNLSELYGDKLNINIFGCSDDDLFYSNLPTDFEHHNHGVLSRNQVADLLRRCHLFLDLSDYQAFGRTGLEAMACGCVALVPSLGGADEYAIHGKNALVVDPRAEYEVLGEITRFIALDDLAKQAMFHECIDTAQNFSVRKASLSVYRLFSKL